VSTDLTSGRGGQTVTPLVLPNKVEAKDKSEDDAERKADERRAEGSLVDRRLVGEEQLWCDDLACKGKNRLVFLRYQLMMCRLG